MGWNQLKIFNEQTCVSPFLDLEKSLMLAGAELDEERKIPLKLRRWGDLGGESWWDDSGCGKMVLGVPGLVLGHTGAEDGVQGWLAGGFKHGLADSLLSPWEKTVKICFRLVDLLSFLLMLDHFPCQILWPYNDKKRNCYIVIVKVKWNELVSEPFVI